MSLADIMRVIDAGLWVSRCSALSDLMRESERQIAEGHVSPSAAVLARLTDAISEIQKDSIVLRLDSPLASATRTLHMLEGGYLTWEQLVRRAQDLRERIEDAFAFRQFVVMDATHSDLWLSREPFGPDVAERFASASDDIEEAAKCLALGRGTAVVFHLMRVLERVIRVLMEDMGEPYDPIRDSDWSKMMAKCNQHLASAGPKQDFYRNALTMLTAVKWSWRNPTIHPKNLYTEEQADEIWRAVRTFTRHLATELSES